MDKDHAASSPSESDSTAGPDGGPEGDLAAVMRALQSIGDAVTADDPAAYRQAVAYGHEIGLSQEQATDAYDHRRRMRHRPVSFDRAGNTLPDPDGGHDDRCHD